MSMTPIFVILFLWEMSFNYYYTKDILVGFRRVGQSRKNIYRMSPRIGWRKIMWLVRYTIIITLKGSSCYCFFLQLLAQDNDTCARPSIPLMDICPPFLFLAVAVVLLLHHNQEPLQSPLLAANFIMRCEMNGLSLSLALTFPVA